MFAMLTAYLDSVTETFSGYKGRVRKTSLNQGVGGGGCAMN